MKTPFAVLDRADIEDGEIDDISEVGELECDHEPSWPTSNSRSDTPAPEGLQEHAKARSPSKAPSWVTMRLLVIKSSILSRNHKLAVVDGYSQLQFGRDVAPAGTDIPRVRLKEMEVSKIHATAYWDKERGEWGVVDMGSKHGTFLKASADPGELAGKGMRLSPMKVASVPRNLRHLDFLTIGGTTFQIHIHRDQVPCAECSPGSGEEIPLFPTVRVQDETTTKRTRDAAGMDAVGATGLRDPKKALTMLKRTLLTRHDDGASHLSARGGAHYMDRSARRRELHATSDPNAPGVLAPKVDLESDPSLPSTRCNKQQFAETSQPPVPLPTTNVGHRLLVKQGWQPGTSLGLPDQDTGEPVGLLAPLEVSSSTNRAGLGMLSETQALPSASNPRSWKEIRKQKRWENIRLADDKR